MVNIRLSVALFMLVAATEFATAQAQGQAQASPQTPSVTVQPSTTLVGCLYREDQVPGRKPNVAERAGILEDYILADAAMPSTAATGAAATPNPTGTTGTALVTGNMYKVEKIAGDRLKALVGKRVEVTGRIDPEGSPALPKGAQPDRGIGPDRISLPEIEASAIKETSGTCPAAPAPLK